MAFFICISVMTVSLIGIYSLLFRVHQWIINCFKCFKDILNLRILIVLYVANLYEFLKQKSYKVFTFYKLA